MIIFSNHTSEGTSLRMLPSVGICLGHKLKSATLFNTGYPQQSLGWVIIMILKLRVHFWCVLPSLVDERVRDLKVQHWLPLVTIGYLRNQLLDDPYIKI